MKRTLPIFRRIHWIILFLLLTLSCQLPGQTRSPTTTVPFAQPPTQSAPAATHPPANLDTPQPDQDTPPSLPPAGSNSAHLELLGQIGGNTYAVAVQQDVVYLGVGPRLVSLDLTHPTPGKDNKTVTPVVLGQSKVLPGVLRSVLVRDRYAYVAAGKGHLQILDITDPARPTPVSAIDAYQYAMSLALDGNRLYVADNAQGLWIADVSDPLHPRPLGELRLNQAAAALAVSGSYVYLIEMGGGLSIIDASAPQQPLLTARLPLPQMSAGVVVDGKYAFIAAGMEGLWVVDVSNPSAPKKIAALPAGWSDGILLNDRTLYLTDNMQGLLAVDISTPAHPTQIGALPLKLFSQQVPGQRQLGFYNDRLLIANQNQGLLVVDTRNPKKMRLEQVYDAPTSGAAFDAVLSGPLACVTRDFLGLSVVQIANPANPVELGAQRSFIYGAPVRTPWKLAAAGQYVYQADANRGLRILDIARPEAPEEIASLDKPSTLSYILLSGNLAWVASNEHDPPTGDPKALRSLRVVDISDPRQPQQIGLLKTESNARSLAIKGNYLYYPDANEIKELSEGKSAALHVIDITNPANPLEIGKADTTDVCPSATSIVIAGDRAYVGDQQKGLCIFDISAPAAPRLVGHLEDPMTIMDLERSGDRLFVAGYSHVSVLDISQADTPQVEDRFVTPGLAWGVTAGEDLVYVADMDGGLLILKYRR